MYKKYLHIRHTIVKILFILTLLLLDGCSSPQYTNCSPRDNTCYEAYQAYQQSLQSFSFQRKKLEPTIMKDPYCSYMYARIILQKRWPEAEPIILTDIKWAFYYTRDVIKDKWPEAEPLFYKSAYISYHYDKLLYDIQHKAAAYPLLNPHENWE